MYKLSKSSEKNMQGIDPRLVEIINEALNISVMDFGIPSGGGLRTAEQQRVMFDNKVSKCDGTKNKSYHQTGKAFDIYAYVDGKASWERAHLTTVATAMLQAAAKLGYPLQWGGLWKNFKDLPHFQLKD